VTGRARTWLLLLCLGALVPLSPAAGLAPVAAAGSTAICFHQWTDTLIPGATTTPQHSTFSSHGETGVIQCSGTVRGAQVTGQGKFGEEGAVHGSCSSGTGEALFSFTLPTSAGPQHFRFLVTFTFGPGVGQTSSDIFPGGFTVRPMRGDCLTTPVTEIAVSRLGVLQS
jgi:hypothetical protein